MYEFKIETYVNGFQNLHFATFDLRKKNKTGKTAEENKIRNNYPKVITKSDAYGVNHQMNELYPQKLQIEFAVI